MITRKPGRCKFCKERLDKLGAVLHDDCIEPWLATHRKAQALKAKREQRAKARVERAKDRARKRELETIPELIKVAQREFNGFIKQRDRNAGHRCISSGRALDWSGNGVDAGHYRSVGAAPGLRFDERNCHAQSKHDNLWKSGNAVEYRIRLIDRIGLEAVEALEADNRVHKWTKDELRAIATHYRAKRKELVRAAEKGML